MDPSIRRTTRYELWCDNHKKNSRTEREKKEMEERDAEGGGRRREPHPTIINPKINTTNGSVHFICSIFIFSPQSSSTIYTEEILIPFFQILCLSTPSYFARHSNEF